MAKCITRCKASVDQGRVGKRVKGKGKGEEVSVTGLVEPLKVRATRAL